MKYAILSDIHSNLEALEAVLGDIKERKIRKLICLGDIVGYGPDPVACLERMRKLKIPTVRGNHDHHAAQKKLPDWFSPIAHAGLVYSRSKLNEEQRRYLAKLPLKLRIGGMQMVHASLAKPSAWPYVLDGLQADLHFRAQTSAVSFCGHTHQACAWRYQRRVFSRGEGIVKLEEGDKYLVNVGSVGLPRDGNPRAGYIIYDSLAREVTFRRLDYDVAWTQRKIIAAGLPHELANRLR